MTFLDGSWGYTPVTLISVTATLLVASDPQPVQIVVSGIPAGSSYVVTGQDTYGNTWGIPGGSSIGTGSSVDLIDSRAPLNSIVTYTAVVDGVSYTSNAVQVSHASNAVLQSLDGQTIVSVSVTSQTEKRTGGIRSAIFPVAGRPYPAVRVDVTVAYQYEWEFDTTGTDSDTMEALLATGRPVVRRLQVGIRDFDPVVIGVVTAWADELVNPGGVDTLRRWSLTVQAVDDPEPSQVQNVYTWSDFDTASDTQAWTWASFDTFWAADSWSDFDTFDWGTLE